jgi:hypothetical protein
MGGGDRKDNQENKACALSALQRPWNKWNKQPDQTGRTRRAECGPSPHAAARPSNTVRVEADQFIRFQMPVSREFPVGGFCE